MNIRTILRKVQALQVRAKVSTFVVTVYRFDSEEDITICISICPKDGGDYKLFDFYNHYSEEENQATYGRLVKFLEPYLI